MLWRTSIDIADHQFECHSTTCHGVYLEDDRNEPRSSPPGRNDPFPRGPLDLKGCGPLEAGCERICRGRIDFRIFVWACFSDLLAISGAGRKNPVEDERARPTKPEALDALQRSSRLEFRRAGRAQEGAGREDGRRSEGD